jgi:hypothetical protein
MIDLGSRAYSSFGAPDSNLVFVITGTHIVGVEKAHSNTYWRTLRVTPLSEFPAFSTRPMIVGCQITFTSTTSIMIYCQNSIPSDSASVGRYQHISFTYTKDDLIFQPLNTTITLPSRVQINQAQSISLNGTVYQFLKFNYDSA